MSSVTSYSIFITSDSNYSDLVIKFYKFYKKLKNIFY